MHRNRKILEKIGLGMLIGRIEEPKIVLAMTDGELTCLGTTHNRLLIS